MYCCVCGPKIEPNWLGTYSNANYVVLLCNACTLPYENIVIKILTYDEFINDQYLAEIVCEDFAHTKYVDNLLRIKWIDTYRYKVPG